MAGEIARFQEFKKSPAKDRLVFIDPALKEDTFPSLNPFIAHDFSERGVSIMAQELKRILDVLLK
ncbi:hypothetical protein [Motiliproteus sp. MSK22-1]|uniref:hypothetical protein n=1 Tax=Motiliproteus sp. MSK22-1 TaxID=1897630 RepID=UPI000977910F|nr:hypothetical protein [Motiliproteus sp. MSK22-1]OMH28088.1 hypothetical protein BGP75_22235 [Motiliproteus sp. MSK22-1]